MQRRTFLLTNMAAIASADELFAEDPEPMVRFGHLRGRFVFDGDPQKPAPVRITKDIEALAGEKIVDESLLVHPDNRGVANVCVWLYLQRGEEMPPVHRSYLLNEKMKEETRPQRLIARKGRFVPHILPVRTDERLTISNDDALAYHARLQLVSNPPIGRILPPGRETAEEFEQEERLPIAVSCSIHPWMRAWLLVKHHPYMAVSDEKGDFEVRYLPEGEWTLQFWHERAGYLRQVNIDGDDARWPRGRLKVKTTPMVTDLGEIRLPPEVFE